MQAHMLVYSFSPLHALVIAQRTYSNVWTDDCSPYTFHNQVVRQLQAAAGSAVRRITLDSSSSSRMASDSQKSDSQGDNESMQDAEYPEDSSLLTSWLPNALPCMPALVEVEGFHPEAYSVRQVHFCPQFMLLCMASWASARPPCLLNSDNLRHACCLNNVASRR